MKKLCLTIALAGVLAVPSLQAAMVSFVNVDPGKDVTVSVTDLNGGQPGNFSLGTRAGVFNLVVDGVNTDAFCIDLQRYASYSTLSYSYAGLSGVPDSWAGPMNAAGEAKVEQLWGNYFAGINSAADPALEAAALQVAIWRAVAAGNGGYSVSIGTGTLLTRVLEMETGLDSSVYTDLRALYNPNQQSFIVPVPEPTTVLAGALLLLPFAASTIRRFRKN
jgi:hypothetical protein